MKHILVCLLALACVLASGCSTAPKVSQISPYWTLLATEKNAPRLICGSIRVANATPEDMIVKLIPILPGSDSVNGEMDQPEASGGLLKAGSTEILEVVAIYEHPQPQRYAVVVFVPREDTIVNRIIGQFKESHDVKIVGWKSVNIPVNQEVPRVTITETDLSLFRRQTAAAEH